jgi:hypothetical protein
MPRTSLKSGKRLAGRMGLFLPSLLVWVQGSAAQPTPSPPSPRFTGTSIPDPPRQREPWTPPDTKLPRFLINATAALFEAGMADPRGCTYRDIEVRDTSLIKTRGFVLLETPRLVWSFGTRRLSRPHHVREKLGPRGRDDERSLLRDRRTGRALALVPPTKQCYHTMSTGTGRPTRMK